MQGGLGDTAVTPAVTASGWELLSVRSGNIKMSEPAPESDFHHCNQRDFTEHLNFLSAHSNSTTEPSES